MVFNPSIPRPTDLLSDSQADLLANNGFLNASFSRNHVALNIATDNGKHKFIEMPVSAAIPAPVPGLSSGEGTLYTKTSTGSQLFYTPDNSSNEYQMTRTKSADFGTFSTFTNYPPAVANQNGGWTFLPGGMLLQYGTMVIAANSATTTIVFPVAFTTSNIVITVTREKTDTSTTAQEIRLNTASITTTQFEVKQSSSSGTNIMHWIAIGK